MGAALERWADGLLGEAHSDIVNRKLDKRWDEIRGRSAAAFFKRADAVLSDLECALSSAGMMDDEDENTTVRCAMQFAEIALLKLALDSLDEEQRRASRAARRQKRDTP